MLDSMFYLKFINFEKKKFLKSFEKFLNIVVHIYMNPNNDSTVGSILKILLTLPPTTGNLVLKNDKKKNYYQEKRNEAGILGRCSQQR